MKTRRVLLLVVALLAAAPVVAAAQEDACAMVGKVTSILAGLRDQGMERATATAFLAALAKGDAQATQVIEELAEVVYDPEHRALDGDVMELLAVKACRKAEVAP